ncbi:hypothetical protein L4D75_19020 [Photobacterium indicum]
MFPELSFSKWQITKYEMRMIYCYHAGMVDKDIIDALNIKANTYRAKKSKLKDKLGLSKDEFDILLGSKISNNDAIKKDSFFLKVPSKI